jgi:thiamine-monophosphate kinase
LTSEFELIRKYFARPAPSAALGVGDDAALLRPQAGMELAVSTDLLLEGRHFAAGADPRKLGHKCLAVNLSDMAAMGAAPRWATLALSMPAVDERWLGEFAAGFYALAGRHGTELVGGDTTRGPLSICVTIMGEVPAGLALFRGGAVPGDDIWVSGELGGAALALHGVGGDALRRLHEPEPRVELGERLRGLASAAIDVSDGFAQDLGHILERSGVGAVVHYEALPKHPAADAVLQQRCVLAGGDDYELIFTSAQARRSDVQALGRELGLSLSMAGSIQRSDSALHILDASGAPLPVPRGFDHFPAP